MRHKNEQTVRADMLCDVFQWLTSGHYKVTAGKRLWFAAMGITQTPGARR